MKIREYISKIGENKKIEDMQELGDMLADIIYNMKESHHELYEKYKMELYIMANGKVLTDDMKREWVKEMKPMAKWTEEEVKSVVSQYGIKVPYMSAYVILNMLYSDMKNALGSGDDEESLKRYLQATNDWYFDEDSKVDGEEKLFNYKFYVVK